MTGKLTSIEVKCWVATQLLINSDFEITKVYTYNIQSSTTDIVAPVNLNKVCPEIF